MHTTITRALALLGEQDAASLKFYRADTAADTLSVATNERPRLAFLDVTIGDGAGISLVHFLQSTVPGLMVIAIVPEREGGGDVRLAEQAASLGAAYVLIGELTGDDVLRAFMKVAPTYAPTIMPPPSTTAPPPSVLGAAGDGRRETNTTMPPAPITEAHSFAELDVRLAELASSFGDADVRSPLLAQLRAAIDQCIVQERSQRAPIQDITTSAYSFAYFVDLAGREIDLARRHGRKFALATVEVATTGLTRLDSRAAVEIVLGAVRDTDVVARADEHELLLMLPETGTKGARTLRRRVLERVHQNARSPSSAQLPVRVGLASFPFDGEDLSRLLRIARRRAERWAILDAPSALQGLISSAVGWLANERPEGKLHDAVGPFVPLDVPLRDAWALLDVMVRECTRAGDATIGLHAPHDASEAPLGLAQAIRASTSEVFGPLSGNAPLSQRAAHDRSFVSVVTGTSRLAEGAPFSGLEVVGILAEHACYGLVGRMQEGRLLALQTHDLPLVEALVNGLEQPVLRRGAIHLSNTGSASPQSGGLRGSRSDPAGLRR